MSLPATAGDDPDDLSAALPGGIQGTDFVFGVPEAFLDRLLEGRPVVCEMHTKLDSDEQVINYGHLSVHRIWTCAYATETSTGSTHFLCFEDEMRWKRRMWFYLDRKSRKTGDLIVLCGS